MTELVVVQRLFDEPADMAELQAREDAVGWCLEQHAVKFVRSYFSIDRRSMICLYRAPDAEAVRETQRQGGLPVLRAWTAHVRGTAEPEAPRSPSSLIVVERDLPVAMTMEDVERVFAERGGCLEIYRATLLSSVLSHDGLRMCCVFAAPDAESVRQANRTMELPLSRAWPATLHEPPSI